MKRRTFLAVSCISALASCSGGSKTDMASTTISSAPTQSSTATPTDTPTETESPTPTRTATAKPEIEVTSEDLVDDDATSKLHATFNARAQQSANPDSMSGGHASSEGEKIVVVRMEVENTGDTNIDLVGAIFALEIGGQDENVPFNLPIGDPQIGDILLQPDESENGWLLASVPEEVTEGTLVAEQNQYYEANYNSSLQVIFEKDESIEIGMDTL